MNIRLNDKNLRLLLVSLVAVITSAIVFYFVEVNVQLGTVPSDISQADQNTESNESNSEDIQARDGIENNKIEESIKEEEYSLEKQIADDLTAKMNAERKKIRFADGRYYMDPWGISFEANTNEFEIKQNKNSVEIFLINRTRDIPLLAITKSQEASGGYIPEYFLKIDESRIQEMSSYLEFSEYIFGEGMFCGGGSTDYNITKLDNDVNVIIIGYDIFSLTNCDPESGTYDNREEYVTSVEEYEMAIRIIESIIFL